jgi:tetratricopeptide (TPR) repeat protein
MTRTRACSLRTLAAMACVLLIATQLRAADPFYENLYRRGVDAFDRGDFAVAVKRLRLACFGFLDDPPLLGEGLTMLALAQAAQGDRAAFAETFSRLAEVEERFGGYAHATIAQDRRRRLEQTIVKMIPEATLAAKPGFAFLVPKPEQRLAALPVKQRRAELDRLITEEPSAPKWRLLAAELEIAQRNPKPALVHAEALVKLAPGSSDGICLRGQALALDERWEAAFADLTKCGRQGEDPRVAEALLRALVGTKRWQDAAALYGQLPAEIKRQEQVKTLGETAQRESRKIIPPTPTPTSTPKPAPSPTPRPASKPTLTPTPPSIPTPSASPTPASIATLKSTPKPTSPPTPLSTPPPQAIPKPTSTPTPVPAAKSSPTKIPAASPDPTATPRVNPAVTPVTGRPAATGATQVATPVTRTSDLTTPPVTGAAAAELSASEHREIERSQDLAARGQLAEAIALARLVADRNPRVAEAQFITAELAYRVSRWSDAVTYFRRGGDPGDDQPLRLFYLAVCLYEAGDHDNAAVALRRALPSLRRTSYVESYVTKILGPMARP